MNALKNIFRKILSQGAINSFYHLPLAIVANFFYGFPTRKLTIIGITGTDGKTTTSNMVYQVLKAAGKKVSIVSTVNAIVDGKDYETGFHVTSPHPFLLQKFAKKAKDAKDEYLILEVTSHALDQNRFWGISFDIGVITNITHEHLDYHKTFDNYLRTKFRLLKKARFAIINQNLIKIYMDSNQNRTQEKIISFGLKKGDFNQEDIKLSLDTPGDYNIENGLAALAVAFVLNIDRSVAQNALEAYKNVPGRMEEVKNSKNIRIVIDFAHTPNGLKQALKTLRNQTKGRIISLIGCEGYRDIGKREMMGEIAQKLSNIVIVTAVDPRGQQEAINRQIETGAMKSGARDQINFFVIEDRQEAINFALNTLAKNGDVVGIFGKGHERSMNLDNKKEVHWSDENAVNKALKMH